MKGFAHELIHERSHWWKMRFYATWAVVQRAAVRNSWSVLMKLVMSYCFKWQNVLLSLPTPHARSPDNVLRRTLSLCSVEQEWSAQAHWFSFREWLWLRRTIIIAQMRHLKVNIHLNKVLSGILLSCCYQAMTMGLQRSRQWNQFVTRGLFCKNLKWRHLFKKWKHWWRVCIVERVMLKRQQGVW